MIGNWFLRWRHPFLPRVCAWHSVWPVGRVLMTGAWEHPRSECPIKGERAA